MTDLEVTLCEGAKVRCVVRVRRVRKKEEYEGKKTTGRRKNEEKGMKIFLFWGVWVSSVCFVVCVRKLRVVG